MRINGYINNNYIWQNKKTENAEGNKQNTQQTEQPEGEVQGKKEAVVMSVDEKRAREAQNKFNEMQNMYQDLMRQLENARAQADAMSDEMETRMKCLKIAMRIMCGDKVPPEDYKYLAEKDMSLYGKAIMMRIQKENPKKHDRVSEDEEDAVEECGSGTESSANVEIALPEISGSGGEVSAEASGETSESSE